MPYRNMSLEDFSRYIGMDVREVSKLADRGKLPGQKVAGQWRFNRARVTEWLQQNMQTLGEERLVSLEKALAEPMGTQQRKVTDLIGLEGIETSLPANTKTSVLKELVNLSERTGLLYDPQGLLKALEEREDMCSTALPNYVAIPHPRQPMPFVSAEPFVCVARLPRGIGFGSPSGELTYLFFLICCHEVRHHLHTLARLMRIFDEKLISDIMHTDTREEILETLIEKENKVFPPTDQ
jgi:PTS system nitrogen regulatory IIA component